jgi:hypothetical protein
MICLHGWRHNLDSLKYFLDIVQMIDVLRDELDFEILLRDAVSLKTFNRIVRTLTIVYQQFPYLNKVKKFPNKKKITHWEYHSVKGFKRYVDFLDYQLFSYDSMKHSLIELPHWIFPKIQGTALKSVLPKRLTRYLKSISPN